MYIATLARMIRLDKLLRDGDLEDELREAYSLTDIERCNRLGRENQVADTNDLERLLSAIDQQDPMPPQTDEHEASESFGLDEDEAAVFADDGCRSHELAGWIVAEFCVGEGHEYRSAGISDPDEAKQWRDHGLDADSAGKLGLPVYRPGRGGPSSRSELDDPSVSSSAGWRPVR